jgi:hypothetical protein
MYEKVKIGRGLMMMMMMRVVVVVVVVMMMMMMMMIIIIIIILYGNTLERSQICMFVVHCSQLSRSGRSDWPTWHDKSLIMLEEDQKPNPVVQRVKVIMSAGLMLVHAHRYVVHTQKEQSYVLTPSGTSS